MRAWKDIGFRYSNLICNFRFQIELLVGLLEEVFQATLRAESLIGIEMKNLSEAEKDLEIQEISELIGSLAIQEMWEILEIRGILTLH